AFPRGERVVAPRLDEEETDALADVRLLLEPDFPARAERDGAQVIAESHRADLGRHAVDPHGPLALLRRVEQPHDGVPRDRPSVLIAPGAGRTATPRAARVIAGGHLDEHRAVGTH